jgi:hypothetical protein
MEGSRNSIFLTTSDVGVVVKRSNPIRIWGAEVKATLGLILYEPSIDDELAVGHGTPSRAWRLLRDNHRIIHQAMGHYRDRPRMHLLQEVTVSRETFYQMKFRD